MEVAPQFGSAPEEKPVPENTEPVIRTVSEEDGPWSRYQVTKALSGDDIWIDGIKGEPNEVSWIDRRPNPKDLLKEDRELQNTVQETEGLPVIEATTEDIPLESQESDNSLLLQSIEGSIGEILYIESKDGVKIPLTVVDPTGNPEAVRLNTNPISNNVEVVVGDLVQPTVIGQVSFLEGALSVTPSLDAGSRPRHYDEALLTVQSYLQSLAHTSRTQNLKELPDDYEVTESQSQPDRTTSPADVLPEVPQEEIPQEDNRQDESGLQNIEPVAQDVPQRPVDDHQNETTQPNAEEKTIDIEHIDKEPSPEGVEPTPVEVDEATVTSSEEINESVDTVQFEEHTETENKQEPEEVAEPPTPFPRLVEISEENSEKPITVSIGVEKGGSHLELSLADGELLAKVHLGANGTYYCFPVEAKIETSEETGLEKQPMSQLERQSLYETVVEKMNLHVDRISSERFTENLLSFSKWREKLDLPERNDKMVVNFDLYEDGVLKMVLDGRDIILVLDGVPFSNGKISNEGHMSLGEVHMSRDKYVKAHEFVAGTMREIVGS
jgi:hypothetical protein